ncbi:MAG: response regulator [bacterium]
MSRQVRILVADRNRHVREFLQRELAAEGFCVETAADGREVLARMELQPLPELLVLDLELPFVEGCEVAARLKQMGVRIPIVVHSLPPRSPLPCSVEEIGPFVEKSGENIQGLTCIIWKSLREAYPGRFPAPRGPQEPWDDAPPGAP